MRRFAIPVGTTSAYGALVALSAWIGVNTDWEENAGLVWALYIAPHVALGVVGVMWWRWAPALMIVPVSVAVAYTDFGCEGLGCIGEPFFMYVLLGVGLLVLIGLAVGAALRAAVRRLHRRRRRKSVPSTVI